MKNYMYYFAFIGMVLMGCDDEQDSASLLANPAPAARACASTNTLVGQSRDLRVSSLYGISGTVSVLSDCEIEFSNFFYNGLGPNVSIYAGVDGNFSPGVGINLSEPIQGRVFEGETFSVFLPEGRTLDEFNSFSVWCFEFDIDFSSATFL